MPLELRTINLADLKQDSVTSYDLEYEMPELATEVLLYVTVIDGALNPISPEKPDHARIGISTVLIDNQYATRAEKCLLVGGAQGTKVSQSENMWFPLTPERKVNVAVYLPVTGSLYITIIGCRLI